MRCDRHNLPLIDEPGGPDMPTTGGRTYCLQCQADLTDALDE